MAPRRLSHRASLKQCTQYASTAWPYVFGHKIGSAYVDELLACSSCSYRPRAVCNSAAVQSVFPTARMKSSASASFLTQSMLFVKLLFLVLTQRDLKVVGLSSTTRISICRISSMRQREVERRAFVDFAFRPYAAAVPCDNALHDGEPYTGSWKFAVTV